MNAASGTRPEILSNLGTIIFIILLVFLSWVICKKAGLKKYLSALVLVASIVSPVLGLIAFGLVGFKAFMHKYGDKLETISSMANEKKSPLLVKKHVAYLFKLVIPVIIVLMFFLFFKDPAISERGQREALFAASQLNDLMEKMTPQIMEIKEAIERKLSKDVEQKFSGTVEPFVSSIVGDLEQPQYKKFDYTIKNNELHLINDNHIKSPYIVWRYQKKPSSGIYEEVPDKKKEGWKGNATERYKFLDQMYSFGQILKDSPFGKHAQYNANKAATIAVLFRKVLDSKTYFSRPSVPAISASASMHQYQTLVIFIDSKTETIKGYGCHVDSELPDEIKIEAANRYDIIPNTKRILENQQLIKWLDKLCER